MKSLNLTGIPEPADRILSDLAAGIENIKPGLVEGIYLTGSIPLNDFHPNKSDIDFLILCKDSPDEKMASQLQRLHERIQKQFKRPRLSGNYLMVEDLRNSNQNTVKVLSIFEGRMTYNSSFGMAKVILHELKTIAHTIFGNPAYTLPINIDAKDLNTFLYQNINSYWHAWVKKHSSFNPRYLFLIAAPQLTEWVILGVARQLYTLQTGQIISKLKAGYYSLETLPAQYHNIIQEAIAIRKDSKRRINLSVRRAYQTIECANFIIDKFNRIYKEQTGPDSS